MKLLMLSIVLVAGSAFAQNASPSGAKMFSVLEASSNRVITFVPMRLTFSSPTTVVAGPLWLKGTFTPGSSSNKADNVVGGSDGLVQLRGNVEIKTSGSFVQADEVDYHLATGEMELRGNVRVKPD